MSRETTERVVDWTTRMARRYGGVVYTTSGERLDWGQALARPGYYCDPSLSPWHFIPHTLYAHYIRQFLLEHPSLLPVQRR